MKLLCWAALAALASSGPASAQLATGRSGVSTSERLSNVRAFTDLRNFGICFVRTQRRDALTLIATVPGSREETQAFNRLVFGERSTCMFGGTQVQASIIYMRGVIAEGLLLSGGVPETHRLPAPTAAEVRNLGDVARCYVAGHRAEAQTVLATRLGSAEETAAVTAVWEDFRTCLPPRQPIRLNAPWIRFLLAEAMLRLAPAPDSPPAG
jgi:hypothetical protein